MTHTQLYPGLNIWINLYILSNTGTLIIALPADVTTA